MSDPSVIYSGYYQGAQAFWDGISINPYPSDDEQHGPWYDGWQDAFDEWEGKQ